MRVCDRHPAKKSRSGIHVEQSDEHYDVCDECLTILRDFLSGKELTPPRKRGRPRKDSAQPE